MVMGRESVINYQLLDNSIPADGTRWIYWLAITRPIISQFDFVMFMYNSCLLFRRDMLENITIGSVTIKSKYVILTAVMITLSLYPISIAQFSSTPVYLGLPNWYWIAAGIISVIYLIQLYILIDLNRNDPSMSHEDDDTAVGEV